MFQSRICLQRVLLSSSPLTLIAATRCSFLETNISANSSGITKSRGMETMALSNRDRASIYRPLNQDTKEMRLLRLLGGHDSSDIQCFLEHSPCPEVANYEAISYSWGDQRIRKQISLNGQPFFITRNAEAVLRSLRHETDGRTLWIDAICINQSDVLERNHQVSMMKEIYQTASKTWIWLGQDEGFAADAIEMIARLAHLMSNRINLCDDPMEILTDYESGLFTPLDPDLPPFSSSKWDSLARYFSQPWFTRVWIIQEVAFSKEAFCICGNETISWDLVQLAAHEIDHQSLDGRSKRRGLDQIQNVISIEMLGSNDFGLFSILCSTRDFQATDPRDKVFAVLGLTQDAGTSLVPDYTQSIAEVYRQAVRFLVHSEGDLTVLGDIDQSAATPSSATDNSFSTWTPRYDQPRTSSILVRAYPPFQASGQRKAIETIPSDSDTLALGGLRIDTLATLGPVMTSDMIANGSGICQIWNHCVRFNASYPTGEPILRAFSMTMVAEKTMKGESAAADPSHDADFAAFITETGHELNNLSSQEYDVLIRRALTGNALRYGGAAAMVSYGRRFFTTTEGFMGLCPRGAKENDLVCVLFGGSLPCVLRPAGEHFQFIGVCYVHGKMDGSVVEEKIHHHEPTEMFNIR